jgi:hypothetical protein
MFHVTRRRVGAASNGKSERALAVRSAATLRKADGVPLPNQGSAYTRGNPVRVRLERGSVVHDWIPQDTVALEKLSWLIYLTDGVIGPALDFYREVPFGPVILSGVKDARRLRLYNDCLDALNIQRFLPYLAGDILVSGRNIIHLVMNERRGYWTELISHMTQHVQIQPSPILGQNPTIDLMVPPEYQRWAISTDPRIINQHEAVDPVLLQMLAAGRVIPLDPDCTVFVPRRASTNDNMGTTLLTRTFAIAALEWAMMDAEATGLRRRASPLTVITAGIENIWEASPDELQAIMELVMAAEEDVVHPTIALRNGIEIHTESGWSELTKWMEQWDVLKNAKLQAIGMNEAFASGEASWSYLESMLSLGMERIRNFRRFIAQEIILEGILAPLARLHGFYKSPQNNADHRIRTATRIDANLDLPTIEWARSLQPTTDRDYLDILVLLQENGLPIPLRKWAQAGGYDIDEAVEGMDEDLALRKRLKYYQDRIEGVGSESLGTEGAGVEGEPTEAKAARVRRALRWRGDEFLGLRKPDVERHLAGCRFPLDQSSWHQLESRLRDGGVHEDSIRALEYGVSRAGLLGRPLSREAIVVVRDELLKTRPLMSQAVTSDLKYLNRQLEAQASTRRNGKPKLSFTIPPATPKLLTGEGYSG